jgi:hypothetical protein
MRQTRQRAHLLQAHRRRQAHVLARCRGAAPQWHSRRSRCRAGCTCCRGTQSHHRTGWVRICIEVSTLLRRPVVNTHVLWRGLQRFWATQMNDASLTHVVVARLANVLGNADERRQSHMAPTPKAKSQVQYNILRGRLGAHTVQQCA